MKKIVLSVFAFVSIVGSASATSGIFGTGVVVNNNGTKTLYEATLLGDARHNPTGVTGLTLNADGFDVVNLGTFTTGVNTLVLNGGEMLTYKNGSDDVTGARILYRLDGTGAFTTLNLTFNENNVSGNNGDQRWYSEAFSINLLSGLSNGAHTLDVYFEAPFTYDTGSGTHVVNNGGANFRADFNVIPEPSTYALVIGGMIGLILLRRRMARC